MAIEKSVQVTVSAVDEFSGTMKTMSANWGAIALAVAAVEAAIIGASIAAGKFAFDLGTTLFQEATVFHDGMLDVKAVTGEAGASMEEIGDTLNKLVVDFPLTGAQAAQAMELIAQRGNIAQDSMEKLAGAAVTLQIATGSDMTTNIEVLSTVMNSLGYDLDEVDRVMNSLAATQFNSAISVTELREAWKFAAPVASQLGYSVEEVNAVLAMLRAQGVEAASAGTIFRQALLNLLRDMPKTHAALAELGLTMGDVSPATNTLVEIFEAFDGKIITAEQSMKIFGTRQGAFTTLVNQGSDALKGMIQTVTGTTAAIDAMDAKMRQWSTVMEMVEGDLSAIQNVIAADLVPEVVKLVGTSATEGIRGIITRLNELEQMHGNWAHILVTGFQTIRDAIGEAFDFQDIDEFYGFLTKVWEAMVTNVEIIGIWAAALLGALKDGASGAGGLEVALKIVHFAFKELGSIVVSIHDLFQTLFYAVNLGVDAVQYAMAFMMQKIYEGIADTWTLLDEVPFTDFTAKIEGATAKAAEWGEKMDQAFDTQAPNYWKDNFDKALTDAEARIDLFGVRSIQGVGKVSDEFDYATEEAKRLGQTFEGVVWSTGKQFDYAAEEAKRLAVTTKEVTTATRGAGDKAERLKEMIAEASYEMRIVRDDAENMVEPFVEITNEASKTVDIVDQMEQSFYETEEGVLVIGKGLEKVSSEVGLAADGTLIFADNTGKAEQSLQEIMNTTGITKEQLEAMSKTEVKLFTERFKNDLEMIKLESKQTHELVKTRLEWEAKIEIAKLEADTKKAVAAFETIAESVSAAADATKEMFGGLAEATGSIHFYELKELVEQQLAIEKALADAQIALVKEQTEYMRLQNERAKRGEATQVINVTVEGNTEEWLKGLMESLFNEIIVKASSEAFACLGPTT